MRIYLGLALLASACTGTIGGDDGTGGDDTMMPPPTDVQILVRDGTAGRANIRVLFQDATGATIAEVPTDATGLAKAEMPAGGNLTVIRMYPNVNNQPVPTEVFTYVGVKAGDRLQLGHELDDLSPPGAINVTVPTDAQGTVTITTPCGKGQGTAPNVAMTATSCPATVAFFVEDGNQNAFVAEVPYANSIDLSGQSLVGTLTTTVSASNVMPTMTSVDAETYIMAGTFMLYASGQKRIDTQPQTVNLPNLHGVDGMLVTTVASQGGAEMVATRSAYAVSPTTVDASAGLIPYVSSVTYSPMNGITWMETGTGTADFELAILDVQPQNAVVGYKRIIVAPHAGTSLVPTAFTGADTMYNPAMTDQIATTYGLVQATGGYDAARAQVFAVSNVTQLAPMNGTVTLSYAGNTPPAL